MSDRGSGVEDLPRETSPSDADRLAAAFEAVAARDRLLAERSRRLAALEDCSARLRTTEARLAEAEASVEALRRARTADVGRRDRRIAELEQRLTQRAAATAAVVRPAPGADATEAEARLAAEVQRLSELVERQRRVLEEKETLIARLTDRPPEPHAPSDDLTRIRGIGPTIAALLHDVGVHSFRQIAGFGEHEVERIGRLLGAFPGRIRWDRWVEQARALTAAGE